MVLLATLVLAGLLVRRAGYPSPEDTGAYLQAVREHVAALPVAYGPWRGEDADVPTAAISLLKPNAALSRRYVNAETGDAFFLWVVHCGDSRDMAGHYPPVCYPNSGWASEGRRPVDLAGGLPGPRAGGGLPGVEYTFSRMVAGRARQVVVANLLLLPDGTAATTAAELRALESDYLNRYRGAAQLQFVFDETLDRRRRDDAIGAFLRQTEPFLNLLRGATS